VIGPPAFRDRSEAGRVLARLLEERLAGDADVVVLGLPRGGVPVAYEVARALRAPLDVFVVRKLGVPGRSELAMGAIAAGGTRVLDRDLLTALRIPARAVETVAGRELLELERRTRAFRGDRPEPAVAGKTVVLVDDGLATGSTMRAAVEALRAQSPRRVVVAVPVGSAASCRETARHVDDVVCAETPEPFLAVGQGYEDFEPTSDDEVRAILARASAERTAS
jgi:predicted phosphoribosyltransferase